MSESLSKNQQQTDDTFGFKWKKRNTYESEAVQSEWTRWLFEKYLDSDPSRLDTLLAGGQTYPRCWFRQWWIGFSFVW